MREIVCPVCGNVLPCAADPTDPDRPGEPCQGDYALCMPCGAMLVLEERGPRQLGFSDLHAMDRHNRKVLLHARFCRLKAMRQRVRV